MVVDCLAMSCRVLHRGVEQRLVQQLAEVALARGKGKVLVKFRPSGKNDLARGFLARLHSWFSSDPAVDGGYTVDCGELNFTFEAQKLSSLEPHHLKHFSSTDEFSKDAISREQQVVSWTNVIDTEDWMGAPPAVDSTETEVCWSQLLQKIANMGPDIPQSEQNRTSCPGHSQSNELPNMKVCIELWRI
eukprot:Skav218670  [mRNA]  locus=scaffold5113:71937:72503:+ [translate_table: standard]